MSYDYKLPIIYDAQFTRDDVLTITTLSAGQLKGMLDRKQVQLMSDHNPGTGRRRMFTGSDILKVETARVAGTVGFPLRWVHQLADKVHWRATWKLDGSAKQESYDNFKLAFYPNADQTDVAFVPILDGIPASPLPVATQMLDVDRLITETLAKLNAVISDEEIPDFNIPVHIDENIYSPEIDFFRMWEKDDEGRTVRTGLTFEESNLLLSLEDDRSGGSFADGEKYMELWRVHDAARHERCRRELQEKYKTE